MTSNPDSDLERGRLAALQVKAAGGDAMARALAWIATAFDETARENTLRRRAERSRGGDRAHPRCGAVMTAVNEKSKR